MARIDVPLLLLGAALLVSLLLFLLDVFPYPFGLILLSIMIALRVANLRSGRGEARDGE